MQGTIAQIVALTTWGNAAIGAASVCGDWSLYPNNSTFAFCENVRFVDLNRKGNGWDEGPHSADPVEWFNRLKNEGVHGLRMSYRPSGDNHSAGANVPDRMLVAFVRGGGRWLIEAVKPKCSDYWEARWDIGDRERSDRRIWRVTYGRIAKNCESSRNQEPEAEELKNRLARNLAAIAEFAHSHKQENFAKAFKSGLSRLCSPDPFVGVYHVDIAPPKFLPQYADQLLATAQAAWVFGGMGSWNDLGFDGDEQTKYERLSEELYQLLNRAIVVAANSSFRKSQ